MSNARKLADNLPSVGQLGNRNLIINGAMNVAQRYTSVNELNYNNDGYWTTDRWKNIVNGSISGKLNMSQDSDAPDGFKYSTKFAVHTADTAIDADQSWRVEQHIEAGNLRHLNYGVGSTTGKKLTLSFWVKSNLTGNWSVGLYMDSVTGGTTTNNNISKTYTINTANTWEYKTLTFIPNDDTNMNSTDNDHGLRLWFHLAAGSNYTGGSQSVWGSTSNRAAGHNVNILSSTSNTWQYTGVQLEVGPQSTPFEHEPYETTLRKCQRYYSKIVGPLDAHPCWTYGTVASTQVPLPMQMRTAPSVTFTGTTASNTNNAVTADNFSVYSASAWKGTNNSGVSYGGTGSSSSQSIRINIYVYSSFVRDGVSAGLYIGSNCSINADAEL
jgi:hypothetical protein